MNLILPDNDQKDSEKGTSRTLPRMEFGRVRVKEIRVPHGDQPLDENNFSNIAESMIIHGQIFPIAVRRVTEQLENGEKSTKINLVAGAHRLAAAKLIGAKWITCVYIDGDDIDARLIQIGENLWRKDLTVLQRAEMLVEWLTVASARVNRSGQVVQKGKTGRLSGGIALAAREVPVAGRSVEARRKIIERAVRIAQLAPEVKTAAKRAGLDNNQRVLLKIAKATGRKAQLKRVEGLAARSPDPNGQSKQNRKATASSRDGLEDQVVEAGQSLQIGSDADDAADDSKAEAGAASVKRVTTLDELEAFWNREGRDLWKYTPFGERERFLDMLRRAKCKAQVDVVVFVKDVFRGRFEVKKRELFALARARGLSKRAVQKTLKDLSYPEKRKGYASLGVWYFRNNDRDWKMQVPSIQDVELIAAGVSEPDPSLTKAVEWSDQADRDEHRKELYGNL